MRGLCAVWPGCVCARCCPVMRLPCPSFRSSTALCWRADSGGTDRDGGTETPWSQHWEEDRASAVGIPSVMGSAIHPSIQPCNRPLCAGTLAFTLAVCPRCSTLLVPLCACVAGCVGRSGQLCVRRRAIPRSSKCLLQRRSRSTADGRQGRRTMAQPRHNAARQRSSGGGGLTAWC